MLLHQHLALYYEQRGPLWAQYAALMAIVFLHEMLDGKQWLGAGLILAAVVLAQLGPTAVGTQETADTKVVVA